MIIRQEDMTYEMAKRIVERDRNPQGWVDVDFVDGVRDHLVQQVVIHLPIWEIYRKLGIPVRQAHFFDFKSFSKSVWQHLLTMVYTEYYLTAPDTELDTFAQYIWEATNYIDEFGTTELAEHQCSISIIDLAEIIDDPVVKTIIDGVNLDTRFGTNLVEQSITSARDKLCKVLSTRGAVKNQALLYWQQAGLLNPNQLQQSLLALGLRTEINDRVIQRPVYGSAASGMRDIVDMAIEQQAGRKAASMNHEAIQTSQYWGRKAHILVSTLRKTYYTDCGAHKTIVQHISASNAKNYIGKFIRQNDGSFVPLTHRNICQFVDSNVDMVTVGGCRHTDGVCAVCGGLLLRNISVSGFTVKYPKFLCGFDYDESDGINIGINSAAETVSQISQMILSTKHLIRTLSQVYVVPNEALHLFVRTAHGINLTPQFRKSGNWKLGVYTEDMYGAQTDLLELTEETTISEERFSSISSLLVKDAEGIISEVPLVVEGQKPFFSMEFLLYMKDHYTELELDDNVLWIPMEGIPDLPVLRAAIVNDSTYAYVLSIIKFLESKILSNYTSFDKALNHFAELVWSKVPKVNIMHLEIMLRAHMVGGVDDWDIPVVDDLNRVTFASSKDVIHNRNYSGQFSFEEHKRRFADPKMYLIPRSQGVFDRNYGICGDWKR